MIRKVVEIYFADPSILIGDHVEDILEAIGWASANLRLRHRIVIRSIDCEIGTRSMMLTLELPDNMLAFSAGNHLRGIANWLLKNKPDVYKKHRVGTRLLYFKPFVTVVGAAG